MMAFSFSEFTNLLNKRSASRKLRNRKLRSMRRASSDSCQSGACARKSSACSRVSGGIPPRQGVQALLARVSVVLLVLMSSVARTKVANCEIHVAISASQAIAEPVNDSRYAVRQQWTVSAGAVRLNHPRRDLARSIGVCPAFPPTP